MFIQSDDRRIFQKKELDKGTIYYMSSFIPMESRQKYFNLLKETIEWKTEQIKIGGNWVTIPRKTAWYGDSSYSYSGLKNTPKALNQPLLDILKVLKYFVPDLEFNSVLLNLYRDGSDSISWHADNEKELGDDPIIASISIGAQRNFKLKSKDGKEQYDIPLKSGSLLIMGNGVQQNYLHCVPKDKRIKEERINLTFRKLLC